MRIYKKQKYIVYRRPEVESPNASLVTGEELHRWIKDGSIKGDDEIYAVRLVAVAREERKIILERR